MSSGTSKNPAQRAIKRIAPKLLELVIVSLSIARTFCGRLLDQYLKTMSYFDPAKAWPKPIEDYASMTVVWEKLAFLGDTRSRHVLLVFAQAVALTIGNGHRATAYTCSPHGQRAQNAADGCISQNFDTVFDTSHNINRWGP